MLIEKLIRVTGWIGIAIGLIAIVNKNIELFLIWQLVGNISAFLWTNYLQRKISWDTVLSLVIAVVAVITKEPFILYTSILVRSISYQFVAEKVFKMRHKDKL